MSLSLQRDINRTRQAIEAHARKLGIFGPHHRWTEEEDDLIRKLYPTGSYAAIKLSGRSRLAISSRAFVLGVKVLPEVLSKIVSDRGCGKDHTNFGGCNKVTGAYVARLRTRRKHQCTVTPQYLDSITVDVCPFSGRALTYQTHSAERGCTASVDRIDSSKGYIEGNVRWIHKDVNRMKWKMNDAEFMVWISIITNYCRDKTTKDRRFDALRDRGDQPVYKPRKKGSYNGYGRITGTCISTLRYWARDRDISHPLLDGSLENTQYLDSIVPAVCPFSGVPLTFPTTHCYEPFLTASLDRIDTSVGYEIGNVRWIHRIVNLMRIDMPDDEFLSLVHEIATHYS